MEDFTKALKSLAFPEGVISVDLYDGKVKIHMSLCPFLKKFSTYSVGPHGDSRSRMVCSVEMNGCKVFAIAAGEELGRLAA